MVTKTIDADGARLLLDIGDMNVEVTVMLEGEYKGISVPREDLVKAVAPATTEAAKDTGDLLSALRAITLENQVLCGELAAVRQILGCKENETTQQALIRRSKEQVDLGRQEAIDLFDRVAASTSNHSEATWAQTFASRLRTR